MAKLVKFDVSDADLDAALQERGLSEAPKPGVYKARISQINPGYSKDDDGKPDKDRPRLEVIYEIIGDAEGDRDALKEMGIDGGDCYGAWLWDYVSFSKASEWKQAQFFLAIGEVSQKKRKGAFDPEKHEGKTVVKLRVRSGKFEGEYRPRVGGTWRWDSAGKVTDEELDEEFDEELEVPTADEIRKMKVAELRQVAREHDISLKGLKKAGAIDKLISELGLEADEDEEDEEEDFEFGEGFEDEEEEPSYSADDVREMGVKELKTLADELGVKLKGMKKSEAIEALISELGLDEEDEEDEDDVPF